LSTYHFSTVNIVFHYLTNPSCLKNKVKYIQYTDLNSTREANQLHNTHILLDPVSFKTKGETIHRIYRNHDYFGDIRFTIRGGRLRYKRYDAHFLKKRSVELPFSSFGDHLINILKKVIRLIYAFKIN
jgi:hypothetical protein